MEFDRMGKPGDSRGFLHKTVFNIAKAVVRTGVSVVAAPFVAPFQAASLAYQQAQPGYRPPVGPPRFQQAGPGIASRTTTRVGPAGVFGTRTTTRYNARAQAERFQGVRGSVSVSRQGGAAPAFCPTQRGTHINRSGYYVQAQPGNPAAGGIWIAKGTAEVPNRSRNAGNGRAVVRATSRIASFDRLARRVRKQMKAACR